jgi:hypothetical protein
MKSLSSRIVRMKALTLALAMAILYTGSIVSAQTDPPAASLPREQDSRFPICQLRSLYERAFEAVLWGMPASAIYRFPLGCCNSPGWLTT